MVQGEKHRFWLKSEAWPHHVPAGCQEAVQVRARCSKDSLFHRHLAATCSSRDIKAWINPYPVRDRPLECLGKERNGNAAVYLQPGCAHDSDAVHNNGLPSAKEHHEFLKVWDDFCTRNRVNIFSLRRQM